MSVSKRSGATAKRLNIFVLELEEASELFWNAHIEDIYRAMLSGTGFGCSFAQGSRST